MVNVRVIYENFLISVAYPEAITATAPRKNFAVFVGNLVLRLKILTAKDHLASKLITFLTTSILYFD